MNNFDYRNLVGCLNYLVCSSRPDIAFAAIFLNSFVENSGKKALESRKNSFEILQRFKVQEFSFKEGR